jgi:RNA polymerase sigma factor (sigma-70 family)
MNKTTKTRKDTPAPTCYRYYGATGQLISEVKVGDRDERGAVVTAEHIAALYESDRDIRRQEWRENKHIARSVALDPATGKPYDEDKDPVFADWSANPESILFPEDEAGSLEDFGDRLAAAIADLLPQQRELIRQIFGERMTVSQIARSEGKTPQAINNRLVKIIARLRKALV